MPQCVCAIKGQLWGSLCHGWGLGIELRPSDFLGKYLYPLSHLTGPNGILVKADRMGHTEQGHNSSGQHLPSMARP